MRYLLAALSTATLLLALTGCGGGSSTTHTAPASTTTSSTSATPTQTANADGSVTSTPRSYGGLQFTLTLNKSSYAKGERVQLSLAVTNTSAQSATAQGYIAQELFSVYQNGTYVAPGGFSTGDQPYTLTWAPGETKTIADYWDQNAADGTTIAAGDYSLSSALTPDTFNGQPFTFTQAKTNLTSNPVRFSIHN